MSFQRELKAYNKEKCEFFGILGIFHQFLLGFLTFSLLILKRYLEKPRRTWIIWFYDVLKQIISSFVLYSANIIFSYLLSNKEDSDLCTIYFMNLFLGCFVGYYITRLYIIFFYYLKKKLNLEMYFNEVYYEEIHLSNNTKIFKLKKVVYITEIIFWTFVQLIWKFILLILFSYFRLIFIAFGEKCLKPFTDIHIKSFMILCFFPLLFNGFYYWKLDSLIKIKKGQRDVIIKLGEDAEKN